jgi:RNA polymerase sigma-70 factor (ECF subfamily)
MLRDTRHDVALVAARVRLMCFCAKLTGNVTKAEDLAHDAIAQGLEKSYLFDGTNAFAWLCMIARNIFFTRKRREASDGYKRYYAMEELRPAMIEADQFDHLRLKEVLSYKPPPVRSNKKGLVEMESPDYLGLLIERAIDDDSHDGRYERLAEKFGIPIGTVRSRLHRGKQMLEEAGL